VLVRILGGIAVYLHCPSARVNPLARKINDLDVVIPHNNGGRFTKLAKDLGFKADTRFNSIHGESRMLFFNDDFEIDVFVGKFVQCHELDLEKDLFRYVQTISLTNLLLTKLQVVEINQKDLQDIDINRP
jgi:hypothetical protein